MGKLTRRTAPRIAAHNGQLTTTSRDIAETFGKEHKDVVRRINALQCSAEFRSAHFYAHPYTLEQNGETYTEYLVTKDGFAFLCMGFTGAKAAAWKEKYIAHFNAMAEKLAKKQPKQPLAHTESAQSAIKQIAYDPTSAIGKDLPPLPAGYEFPPEIMAQIEAAVIPQAMACIPALRSYMMRRVKHMCTNAHGLDPQRVPQAIATASLASALAHTAHEQYHHICTLITSLHTVTGYAAEKVQQAAQGQGAA